MSSSRRLVMWPTVLLFVIVATLAVALPARAAPACRLDWRVQTWWPAAEDRKAGFSGEFMITNTGDTTSSSWRLATLWPTGTTLESWWNAERVVNPLIWAAYNFDSYPSNGVLRPGESTIVGVSARELSEESPNRPTLSSCRIS